MSDIGCCVFGPADNGPSCSSSTVRTARKDHRCCECREIIGKGQRYEYLSGVWDGSPASFKTCLSCVEIRQHFAGKCDDQDSMPTLGQLWSDIEDNFFPEMRAGGPCLDGLSPEAKGRMFERRLAWLIESDQEVNGAPPPRAEP